MIAKAPINMRVLPEQKELISKAAAILNMDRTTFILNVACKEAENILLNQRLFQMNEADFSAFEKQLNAPLETPEKLKQLFAEQAPWES